MFTFLKNSFLNSLFLCESQSDVSVPYCRFSTRNSLSKTLRPAAVSCSEYMCTYFDTVSRLLLLHTYFRVLLRQTATSHAVGSYGNTATTVPTTSSKRSHARLMTSRSVLAIRGTGPVGPRIDGVSGVRISTDASSTVRVFVGFGKCHVVKFDGERTKFILLLFI